MRGAASLAFAMIAGFAVGDDTVGGASSLYRAVSPSVVTITVSARDGHPIATGSGVIISASGQILTNYHVVSGGVFYGVKIPGRPEPLPGRATKCAPEKDLAMLSVTSTRPLRPARLARQRPSVGARVAAVGSPLSLEGSITDGVVSQFRSEAGIELIQTTAPMSPGSSGGGLFTLNGELAGITTMTLKTGQALNFAVSIAEMSYLEPCGEFPLLTSEDSETGASKATPTPLSPPEPLPCNAAPFNSKYSVSFDQPQSIIPELAVTVTGWIENTGCQKLRDLEQKYEVYRKDSDTPVEVFSVRPQDSEIQVGRRSFFKATVTFRAKEGTSYDCRAVSVRYSLVDPTTGRSIPAFRDWLAK